MCFEFDFAISADGRSLGNGSADCAGYGSYWLESRTGPKQVVRLDFGGGVTNDEAEYQPLVAALKNLTVY